jgi:hypothetical protein
VGVTTVNIKWSNFSSFLLSCSFGSAQRAYLLKKSFVSMSVSLCRNPSIARKQLWRRIEFMRGRIDIKTGNHWGFVYRILTYCTHRTVELNQSILKPYYKRKVIDELRINIWINPLKTNQAERKVRIRSSRRVDERESHMSSDRLFISQRMT